MSPKLYPKLLCVVAVLLCACDSAPNSADAGSAWPQEGLKSWPAYQSGEYPPAAPAEVEAVIASMDNAAGELPLDVITQLADPLTFGVTTGDMTDPSLVAFHIRASVAQLNDGSRPRQNHWF